MTSVAVPPAMPMSMLGSVAMPVAARRVVHGLSWHEHHRARLIVVTAVLPMPGRPSLPHHHYRRRRGGPPDINSNLGLRRGRIKQQGSTGKEGS